jgi:ubiquinone biosynthesis protein
MFTMSFVDGYSISKKERVIEEGYDVNEIGKDIVENYVHQILDVGTFHADPHQGNIMISHGKPVWIDFGMLGRLSDGDISIIQSLVLAVIGKDAETLANAVMSLGAASAQTNRDRMMEDLDAFLDRYCSVGSLNDLDLAVLFEEISNLAAKHHVKLPGRFTMLIRSLATIEGVIEQFCPDMQLFQIISNKLMSRAKDSFDLQQELMSLGKDAMEISTKAAKIPALASDVLKGVARGRTKINLELTGYEELLKKSNENIQNIVLSVFACVVFFGSCIMCTADLTPKAPGGMPAIAGFGLVFSVALAIHAFGKMLKKK